MILEKQPFHRQSKFPRFLEKKPKWGKGRRVSSRFWRLCFDASH